MSEYVTVEIKGLAELQKALENKKERAAKVCVGKALRAGATVMRDAIVALAPHSTGFLASHFGIRVSLRRDALAGSAFVGPQGKVDYPLEGLEGGYKSIKNKKGKVTKIGRIAVATVARFLEFGTSRMAKKPFMTSAFESTKQKSVDAMTEKLKELLQ